MRDPAPDEIFAASLAGRALGGPGLVLRESTDGGGGGDPPAYMAPLHVHHSDDEAWYVLEGALRFRLGDHAVEAPAGGAVIAPRGTPHTFWNPRPEPARYLLVMTPTIERLIDALHVGPLDRAEMEAVFRDHDSAVIEWL